MSRRFVTPQLWSTIHKTLVPNALAVPCRPLAVAPLMSATRARFISSSSPSSALRRTITNKRSSYSSPEYTISASILSSLSGRAFGPTSESFAARPPLSVISILKRAFHNSRSSAGPRSYYPSSSSRSLPTANSFKSRINRVNPQVILYALIALNVAVFLNWQYGHSVLQQFRDPSVLRFLGDNFTTSWRNLQQGRIWCVITSCFSHESSGHILMNLLSLYFMGPPVMYILGNLGFLYLYLFSGTIASLTSLVFSKAQGASQNYSSHGASGAIYGTLAFFAAAHPRTTFLLFFVVPVPAWACVGGILAWDLYGALRRRGGTTDSAGHVGGVLAGLFWFMRISRRFG